MDNDEDWLRLTTKTWAQFTLLFDLLYFGDHLSVFFFYLCREPTVSFTFGPAYARTSRGYYLADVSMNKQFTLRSEINLLSSGNTGKTLPVCRKYIYLPQRTRFNQRVLLHLCVCGNFLICDALIRGSILFTLQRRMKNFYQRSFSIGPTWELRIYPLLCGPQTLTSAFASSGHRAATPARGHSLHLFLKSSAYTFGNSSTENCSSPCGPVLPAAALLLRSHGRAAASGQTLQLFFITLTTQQMRRCRDRGPERVPCIYSFTCGQRRRPRTRWRVLPR